jgi:two-component system, NarL family, invasion response regulator UvrY
VHGSAAERGDGPRREDELPVGVLVVDDQEQFRKALCDLVSATPELVLVGEAETGEAALDAVESLSPRMVIMDKRMPGMGGVEATRMLKARHPDIVVLLVSVEVPESELMRSCGAAGFLRKQQLSPRVLTEFWQAHGR